LGVHRTGAVTGGNTNTPQEIHDAECRIQHNVPENEWRDIYLMLWGPLSPPKAGLT
jgi:hypothetical protein